MATIQIAPPQIQTIHIPIVGKTPLIVHRFGEKARRMMLESMQKTKGKAVKAEREPKNPEAEFNASRYVMTDGRDGLPAAAFKQAAVRAAKMVDGLTMADAKQLFFVCPTGVCPTGEQCVGIVGEPVMREDFVRVKNGGTDLRYRAEYPDWSATLEIEFDPALVSADTVANLIARAGMTVGVGEWRPEKGGINGTFAVGAR